MLCLKSIDARKLLVSLIVCQAAGFIGSLFTRPAIPSWYAGLVKPSYTPPDYVFAPVWITLYCLMGLALYLVWRRGVETPWVRPALLIFALQLMLNAGWSWLFFGLRSPLAGLQGIVFLWVMVLMTIVLFRRVSLAAALLLVPYLLWVSYATRLTWCIWRLNP